MALVLKKLVVVEEGKIPVDSVSTLIPSDANVRVKGRHVPVEERATMEQEAGFVLGEEMEGLVVAHHGSRVLVQVEEQSKELLTKLEEPAANMDTLDVRSLRYSCALNPSLKEIGVVTGDRVNPLHTCMLAWLGHSLTDKNVFAGCLCSGVGRRYDNLGKIFCQRSCEQAARENVCRGTAQECHLTANIRTVLDRPSKSISELNVNDLQVLVPGYFLA